MENCTYHKFDFIFRFNRNHPPTSVFIIDKTWEYILISSYIQNVFETLILILIKIPEFFQSTSRPHFWHALTLYWTFFCFLLLLFPCLKLTTCYYKTTLEWPFFFLYHNINMSSPVGKYIVAVFQKEGDLIGRYPLTPYSASDWLLYPFVWCGALFNCYGFS